MLLWGERPGADGEKPASRCIPLAEGPCGGRLRHLPELRKKKRRRSSAKKGIFPRKMSFLGEQTSALQIFSKISQDYSLFYTKSANEIVENRQTLCVLLTNSQFVLSLTRTIGKCGRHCVRQRRKGDIPFLHAPTGRGRSRVEAAAEAFPGIFLDQKRRKEA